MTQRPHPPVQSKAKKPNKREQSAMMMMKLKTLKIGLNKQYPQLLVLIVIGRH
ncbi:Hypothetical protein P9303_03581 [Prochlorococcus marinus str. MIT 9303]|uniref:Uncharacterized protein n=1 Tax=Prochlorococcus marinus (strain MIT 9303) TaxID=59922 RepID=A2C6K0_PROM3|nr:Hypothetical protein P9303_03581 [Prochlorococcus marinus str. MIT 9303]